ncbi:MAG TPA: PAC2 family protein, partial [bacterium]|nr:PAC2 family protein [bacterium]
AFEGWNDGGTASSKAVRHMIQAFNAEKFASLDPEEFYVFSENRPQVKLVDGRTRRIQWQVNDFYCARLPGTERDVILFHGTEPNVHWQTYCSNVMSVAQAQDCRQVATLGAYLADVLYTLPVQVTGFCNNLQIEERYGIKRTSYEGPTGIVGVLSGTYGSEQLTMLSLWAAVPYYISIPNPKAVHALLSKLKTIFAFEMEMESLEKEADSFDNEINDVVARDPNVAAYVRELKKREFLN